MITIYTEIMSLRRGGKQKPIKEEEDGREGKATYEKEYKMVWYISKLLRQKIENMVGQRSSGAVT